MRAESIASKEKKKECHLVDHHFSN